MSQDTTHPTPSLTHLTPSHYREVYEPAEDSFLLMDALEKDSETLRQLRPLICVEIGSGSGAVITFLATLLQTPTFYLATDINPTACACSKETMHQNKVSVCDITTSDLILPLKSRLRGIVDILIFNPPYVVTPTEEVGLEGIEASWAGGKDGREVTDRLLADVSSLLSPTGVFYLITLPENKPDEICSILEEKGLEHTVVLTRKTHNERLSVIKFNHIII